MPRLHLFEFEDFPWFPRVLRALMTDYLSFMAENAQKLYAHFTQRLHGVLQEQGTRDLVELCSGGGGPAWTIASLLRKRHGYPVKVLLTDLYPNQERLQRLRDLGAGDIDFCPDPVDATRVPPTVSGFRLLCNSFHHFREDAARAILSDAVGKGQGIAVVELVDRSVGGLSRVLFMSGMVLVVTPLIRPLRLSRFLFTYVIPAVPLFILWDGVVSCLRVYSPAELRALTASLSRPDGAPDYEWEIGQTRAPPVPGQMTFLIGRPRARADG